MILIIARHELRRMFLSPLAWSILAVVQLIMAFMFLGHIEYFRQVQSQLLGMDNPPGLTEIVVGPLLGNAAIVLLLVVPLISMRLISEERRNKTLSLLYTAPTSMIEIVIGKFLGLVAFLYLLLALLALMPLALLFGGGLDYGMFAAGLVGLMLLLAGFAAVGIFTSTLTQHPAVAAIACFGMLLLFWILDWAGEGLSGAGLLGYLSLLNHYEPFLKGVFGTGDLAYYVLFTVAFLGLAVRRLDMDRLGV